MDGLITIINNLYNQQIPIAQSMAETIEGYVRVFAAIGALVYIFSRVIVQIANNQDIDIFPLLRPFVLMCCIPFAPAICNGIDKTANSIRTGVTAGNLQIAEQVKQLNDKLTELVDKKWETIRSNPESYKDAFGNSQEEDSKFLGMETSFVIDFKISMAKAQESLKFQLLAVLQHVLIALMYVAETCLFLVSIGYRIVLRMGFPITLALAIFPGFSMAIANWAGRYIQFALMPAVAAMYSSIGFGLVKSYLQAYDVTDALNGMGAELQQPEYLGLGFMSLLIVVLIGYTQVPSMTHMLVTVGGVGSIVQGATRGLSAVGGGFEKASATFTKKANAAFQATSKKV
ncbi:hypothetical protein [Runella limosa]|uniref:hypothetical protein n=1 Tax=Runella limosa TaxID=370978 RepID=UPI00041FBEEF|nr:hypothetical protein [Runella limosa]